MKKFVFSFLAASLAASAFAQQPVAVGRASYAPYPPPYKGKTDAHPGFNASYMLSRKIYAVESDADGNPRPIPTNDWWTDVINNQFSGALWSYPAMLKTAEDGVTVVFPTYWNDNGTEVKPSSWVKVQGAGFTAAECRAADWHDWDVELLLPAAEGDASIKATLAHGQIFSWFEFDGQVRPEITFSEAPAEVARSAEGVLIKVGADLYGFYLPAGVGAELRDGTLALHDAPWLSVALLKSEDAFTEMAPYAASVVRRTEVAWRYDEASSLLHTSWQVTAENLRSPGAPAPVMQGFLPHAYKYAAESAIAYTPVSYLTPRGEMKMASAADGKFEYAYRFAGMLPYYAAPKAGNAPENGYDAEMMRRLMKQYAEGGSFGADTYWGGKGLTQMALNMTFAKETGEIDLYELSRQKLKDALTDWLTYTPGEQTRFFAYYPRWGGMLGFDVSYDSDAFNDHHFHYGYFIYAAALLCMEDKAFADNYGELLTMIAKDYANYDRRDTRFPFLRNLDPWAGHSYAGGLGDHGNDNGNGQESSSEAMQGWGGVYLLGTALGNRELRDAGIFGWLTESRGTAEYWFDRDHIYPDRQPNYDYSLYEHPYNTNLTSKGIGWWTWFSGDPLWMHSIQWMPVSPCLNYLSEDLGFVKWDYETMRSSTGYDWFEDRGKDFPPLADQSVGNVVLSYMERYDPAGAAAIFNQAWEKGMGIARNVDTGHISYFVIQSHLTYGDIDFSVSADCPTANLYRRADGTDTYMVYNPGDSERTVRFFRDGAVIRTVKAPARKLTAFTDEAGFSSIAITSSEGTVIAPGGKSTLSADCFDQYGASAADAPQVVWSVAGSATVSPSGELAVAPGAQRGSKVTVTAKAGEVEASLEITVNDPPVVKDARITGLPAFVETATPCSFALELTDQYGEVTTPAATWTVTAPSGASEEIEKGEYTFTRAGIYTVAARAGEADPVAATIKVLPPLPDAALRKPVEVSSEENAGTLKGNATDGDHATRWGSAHSDDQWITVDLGSDHHITAVAIDWETAFAADYDVEVASSAAPSEWKTAFSQRGLSSPGIVTHQLGVQGRYVRINCLRRATQYGYSLFEIEVRGVPVSIADDETVGIDVAAPAVMLEGESATLGATALDFSGRSVSLADVKWSSTPEGEFSGSDFKPLSYGLYTVKAAHGKLTASANILVEESVKLAQLTVAPERLTLVSGEAGHLALEGRDQFGGVYPLDDTEMTVRITSGGKDVDPATASFNLATGMFFSQVPGDYMVEFNGRLSVPVSVRDISEVNLALGKPARATSAENGGLTAAMAVDGDLSTRWGSTFSDDQAITVDLKNVYLIDNVKVYWNKPAFATRYTIDCSRDGVEYFPVVSRSNWSGEPDDAKFTPVEARYVRLTGHERATQWGTSIDELEVYGSHVETSVEGVTVMDSEYVDVYTPGGLLLQRSALRAKLHEALPAGLYIIRSGSSAAKLLIP